MDIKLNENFDIQLNERNDLPIVTGREKFEQRVRIVITELLQDTVGENNSNTTLKLIRLKSERLAQNFDVIDSIVDLSAEYDKDEPNIVNLRIIYDTGDEFQAVLSE